MSKSDVVILKRSASVLAHAHAPDEDKEARVGDAAMAFNLTAPNTPDKQRTATSKLCYSTGVNCAHGVRGGGVGVKGKGRG